MNKLMLALIPALLAGTAAAQVVVLPGARPYPAFPASLPSPVASYPVPLRIELPAPLLTPGRALVLAPTPAVASFGVLPALPLPAIPSRPRVPVVRATAERENVRHPLAGIAPLRVRLAESKKNASEELFDGRRAPVRPEAVMTLPERDLEDEIGVAPDPANDSSLNY